MNRQTPEAEVNDTRGRLEVVKIFHTIQGEGPLVGTPSVFVRLAGCNLQCRFCDTDYTSGRRLLSPEDILWEVQEATRGKTKQVVLTGGEPFRQNIAPAVELLLDSGFFVQIETNGTLYKELDFDHLHLFIVCSPKRGTVNDLLMPFIGAFKYVVGDIALNPLDGLPKALARPNSTGQVYLQPIDDGGLDSEKTKHNTAMALESCMKFGYRLSLQTHKIIGVD